MVSTASFEMQSGSVSVALAAAHPLEQDDDRHGRPFGREHLQRPDDH